MAFVYVLKCADGSFYTGATKSIKRRLKSHHKKKVKYTKSRLPVKLVFLKEFLTLKDAFDFEKRIKSWKKRRSIEKMFCKQDNLIYCRVV